MKVDLRIINSEVANENSKIRITVYLYKMNIQ